jgi:hypothetical protein
MFKYFINIIHKIYIIIINNIEFLVCTAPWGTPLSEPSYLVYACIGTVC